MSHGIDRWQQIEHVYNLLLDHEPLQRDRRLNEVCAGDASLRFEIETLLEANERAGSFLAPAEMKEHLRQMAADEAPSRPGTVLGHYEILSVLGSGGMGEVYLGHDRILDREVALKILPAPFMQEEKRMMRFVREAKAASALNHPNILTIYEVGQVAETHFIVTEFVKGETLRQKAAHGGIAVADAIEIAIQCAEALKAAHAAGIVHRDIKPENVMVRPDGLVKLLDFGLARTLGHGAELAAEAAAGNRFGSSPGFSTTTVSGVIVGTPRYMSPEQASGLPVDERTDLFSLGTVLYEMVTGQPPFSGATSAQVIQKLLADDPPPTAMPAGLAAIVAKMLKKERPLRYQSAGEIAHDLRLLQHPAPGFPVRARWPWAVAAAVAIMGLSSYYGTSWFATPPAKLPLTVPLTTFTGDKNYAVFSPDASRIAFAWDGGVRNAMHIYTKTIGDAEPVQLTFGPHHDWLPDWSPDGRNIAFQRVSGQRRMICVVPPSGGPPRELADGGVGVSWSPNGKSLAFPDRYPPDGNGGIVVLDIETGRRRQVTNPQPYADGLPVFSPDGMLIAFDRSFTASARELMVAPAEGGAARRITFDKQPVNGQAWTADSRELVFESTRYGGAALWRVSAGGGQPRRVETTVQSPSFPSISRRGDRLAYTETFIDSNIWRYEGAGFENGDAPKPFASAACVICSSREDESQHISPDGRRIVFVSKRTGADEIWVADQDGGRATRLTFFGGAPTGSPCWSVDGRWIAFDSRAAGQPDIYLIGSDGGTPRRVTSGTSSHNSPAWSHDGRSIYFSSAGQIYRIPSAGGEAVQITRNGGNIVFESADGKVLYYNKSSGGIWSIPVDGGLEQAVSELRDLPYGRSWDVTREGIYFLDQRTEPQAIRFLSFRTRRLTTLLVPSEQIPAGTPALALSPDGRRLLVARVAHRVNDLIMIDNFQ